MKKLLCLILALCLVFLCSCNAKNGEEEDGSQITVSELPEEVTSDSKIKGSVSLGYYSDMTLNPFKTESKTNREISTLLYDSLFKLDSQYNAEESIASSFEADGKTLTVNLKSDVQFSNGVSLTASDVVYSFEKAKKSEFYAQRLSVFKSAYQSGSSVVFSLSRDDIYAVNCLDFPIVKSGTGDDSIPVGSGRYVFSKKEPCLKKNKAYAQNEEMEIEEIKLYDLSSAEDQLYLLQIGDLTFAFEDLADKVPENKINANTVPVSLNNLVFLSFNSESEELKDKNIKSAIVNLLDKTVLTATSYGSNASPSETVFNPSWSAVEKLEKEQTGADSALAAELLEKSGYIYAYSNNKIRSKNFEFLELSFVVSESDKRKVTLAKEIAKALKKAGIGVNLSVLSFDDYKKAIQNGDFDLYLGEIKLTNNMNLSPFFSENGNARYGIDRNTAVKSAYYDFIGGKIDMTTFLGVFEAEMPFIPICYRNGIAYYSRELQYEGQISENDVFANIYSWVI